MDGLKMKTTVPYPSVGADGGQSLSQKPNQSIAEGVTEHKPPERDLEEIMRQISRVNDPAYLPTVSMNDLYEQVYPGRPPVIDGLRGHICLWALPKWASPFSWPSLPTM